MYLEIADGGNLFSIGESEAFSSFTSGPPSKLVPTASYISSPNVSPSTAKSAQEIKLN